VIWLVGGGVGGNPRVALRVEGGGTMEGSEKSDKRLGLIRNRVPIRALKFDFEIGVLLGVGRGVVGRKRELATEENVGDHGCTGRAMSLCYVCA